MIRRGPRAGIPGLPAVVMLISILCCPCPALAISVGDRAPDFTLTDQTGVSHSLSSEAGKARLLYFFGHSAQICAETARQIESDFQSNYGAKGLTILGLDCWDGTADQLREFATANGVTFPLLAGAGETARQYDISYHSFVIVDGGGIVRMVSQGPDASAYDQARIERTIKSLLQDPSATEEQTWGAIKVLFAR